MDESFGDEAWAVSLVVMGSKMEILLGLGFEIRVTGGNVWNTKVLPS